MRPFRAPLTALPEAIGKLTSLEVLDLSDWKALRALPPAIGGLASLRSLLLNGCGEIAELPSEIGDLAHLEILDLGGTPLHLRDQPSGELSLLTSLPERLSECSSLTEIDLSVNAYARKRLDQTSEWRAVL